MGVTRNHFGKRGLATTRRSPQNHRGDTIRLDRTPQQQQDSCVSRFGIRPAFPCKDAYVFFSYVVNPNSGSGDVVDLECTFVLPRCTTFAP